MGHAIHRPHPAVLLRFHYTHLRALLAIAMVAVVGLTVAVVVLAGNEGAGSTTSAADPAPIEFRVPSHVSRHGGAPVPDLRTAPVPNGRRYDGAPEEGTRGNVATQPPNTRHDGRPEEDVRARPLTVRHDHRIDAPGAVVERSGRPSRPQATRALPLGTTTIVSVGAHLVAAFGREHAS